MAEQAMIVAWGIGGALIALCLLMSVGAWWLSSQPRRDERRQARARVRLAGKLENVAIAQARLTLIWKADR